MSTRFLRHAAIVLAVVLGLLASAAVSNVPRVDGATAPLVERSVLANGITLSTEQRTAGRVAAIVLTVQAGSRFEEEQTDSAAHLLEHLFLQGTSLRPNRATIAQAITGVGGTLSVNAGWELLTFSASSPATDLNVAEDVLSDLLLGSRFEADALEKERAIAAEELAALADDPRELAFETLSSQLFAGSALRRLPSGSERGLDKLSLQQLLAFRDRFILPNRAALAVVSPYPHETVRRQLEAAFGAWQPGADPQPLGPTEWRTPPPTHRIDLKAGSEQAQVAIGLTLPGVDHPDRAALLVLQAVLNGFSGRLVSEIRDQRGLAYETSAEQSALSDAGLFVVWAGTPADRADEVLELLRLELARLGEQPLEPAELARAAGMVVGGQMVDSETALARAQQLAGESALQFDGSSDGFLARVRRVTAAEAQRTAQTYFAADRQLAVVVKP